MEPCSPGNILQDELHHKTTYSRKAEINDFKFLSLHACNLCMHDFLKLHHNWDAYMGVQ